MTLPQISLDAIRILDQSKPLFEPSLLAQMPFAEHIGPHLRHIIEHFDELIDASELVNYDARVRNEAIQTSPNFALSRLERIRGVLRTYDSSQLNAPISVRLLCGASGEFESICQSTLGRELLFASSHATHHYALIKCLLEQKGVSLSADFGKAPATVAFEKQLSQSA